MKKLVLSALLLPILVALPSCEPWFAYSPYDADLDEAYRSSTRKNLELINANDRGDRKPFKVALLSDSHYHFSKLTDAIDDINERGDYDFAIVTGDISENGLKQEFVYFYEHMKRLKIPYVTVIGNHDYLSNGEIVYGTMFGDYNYTFVYNNVKFVLFDNTTIESGKDPDMDWLAAELSDREGYDHVIPFSHIPPYDGQMEDHHERFHSLMVENEIGLAIHGHRHDFSIEEPYGDGVRYVTVSSPQKRKYSELIVAPDEIEVRNINY